MNQARRPARRPPAAAQPDRPLSAHTWPQLRLETGRDRLSRTFHPWVFSGAVVESRPGEGAPPADRLPNVARVVASDGRFVAWGIDNPQSKIRARLFEWNEAAAPDRAWLDAALRRAFAARAGMHDAAATTAARMVFSESDNLPGLVVDRLGPWLLVQSESAAMDAWLPLVAASLAAWGAEHVPGLRGVIERSDGDGRNLEGLPPRRGLLWGEAPTGPFDICEDGIALRVDPAGQKTGFYADQRENRRLVARYAAGRRILDVCCYGGAFSAHAWRAGAASLTLVDASADALELARSNLPPEAAAEFVQGDAFQTLRDLRERGRAGDWDLIVLDPPKLAPNRQSLERALAAYKDLNLQAMRLLAPGGLLATFSCSGLVSPDQLRQAVSFAAKDLGRQAQIVHQLFQAPCHPVPLGFPEAHYLKGFILRVL